jgi:hypothetical protein
VAVLRGFDVFAATTVVSSPLVIGQLLAARTLPAGYVVGGLDLTAPALDPGGPLSMTVGDPADTDRLLQTSSIGADGGTVEWRPEPVTWHRYAKRTTVSVRVSIPPLAAVTGGNVTLVLYTYPASTLATAQAMVLEELGILKEDGVARAEELAQARQAVTEAYDELRGLGLGRRIDLEWPVDLIPTWAVRQVAKIGAKKLMGVFGLSMPRRQVLQAEAGMAEREMRRQCAKSSLLQPVVAEYY